MGLAPVSRIAVFPYSFGPVAVLGSYFFPCAQPDNDAHPLISASRESSAPLAALLAQMTTCGSR